MLRMIQKQTRRRAEEPIDAKSGSIYWNSPHDNLLEVHYRAGNCAVFQTKALPPCFYLPYIQVLVKVKLLKI
jgi:hypothetical protein